MSVTLSEILALVGKLDDTPGDDAPRERFRRYLRGKVMEAGQVRDYVEECLRSPGDQYNRALQDLVNHTGSLLGFDVEFGRYQGVQGKIGFDGFWKSPKDYYIVVEVKATEVYAVATSTLLNYINELVSTAKIADSDSALGPYVVGRPNPEVRQLENAIVAEKRTQQLRVISVDALLLLAEMNVAHEDILNIGCRIDQSGAESSLRDKLLQVPGILGIAQILQANDYSFEMVERTVCRKNVAGDTNHPCHWPGADSRRQAPCYQFGNKTLLCMSLLPSRSFHLCIRRRSAWNGFGGGPSWHQLRLRRPCIHEHPAW